MYTKIIVIAFILVSVLSGCAWTVNVQISTTSLAPCPESPNCVSSLAHNPSHKIEPFPIYISGGESLRVLREILGSFERTEILWETGRALSAIVRTRLGFVDDVQFLVDETASVIHVRSAARVGYWDLGVNRNRVEQIRREYQSRMQRLENTDFIR